MINSNFQYPIFGSEIKCPHCNQTIQALTLTDSYLCDRHGPFEANPETQELVHLQSERCWKLWDNKWYRQHSHPDGIRFEIHEALDNLYHQNLQATKIIIARRYQTLIMPYLENDAFSDHDDESKFLQIYRIPVEFSPVNSDDLSWNIINFTLETEPRIESSERYPYIYFRE